MDALSLISKKRCGGEHSPDELRWLVEASLDGRLPDYQLSAWLMAACLQELSFEETVALTEAFVDSGIMLDWSAAAGEPLMSPATSGGVPAGALFVDKHSTGGVGDKVSLLLTPWLAEAGYKVAKMSGRGLGHTGGTIDKLASIPGFRTDLSLPEAREVLDSCGCVILQQTGQLVPADKRWYALRDATATVDSLGLIAASVMSKKLAGGAPLIVLDVKCGSGAFFASLDDARAFAGLAGRIGAQFGRKVACVISRMDEPLGEAVGNAIEVLEALRVMEDAAEIAPGDPAGAVIELCGRLLAAVNRLADATEERSGLLSSGAVAQRFADWVAAQGGLLGEFLETHAPYFAAGGQAIPSPREGVVQSVDAALLGSTLARLGAGRLKADDVIDPQVGLLCHAKVGHTVGEGEPLATVFGGSRGAVPQHELDALAAAFTLGDAPAAAQPLVVEEL